MTRSANQDVGLVGGKNASPGEMFQHLKEKRIAAPNGFATTVEAYLRHLERTQLALPIAAEMEALSQGGSTLAETGAAIRDLILTVELPADLAAEVREIYRELCRRNDNEASMRRYAAVRRQRTCRAQASRVSKSRSSTSSERMR